MKKRGGVGLELSLVGSVFFHETAIVVLPELPKWYVSPLKVVVIFWMLAGPGFGL